LVSDLAFSLAADGHDAPLPRFETLSGVHVHRVGLGASGSRGLGGRLSAYVAFYALAALMLRKVVQPKSVVVAKTDPPLLSVLVRFALAGRDVKIVNWLQDLYPEVAQRLGVRFLGGGLGRALIRLRDHSLRKAAANVVLGEGMAEVLAGRDIPPGSTRIIPNWVDDDAIQPVDPKTNTLRLAWGLADVFVVGYSGNLGRAHEFDTLVAAAEQFRGRSDVRFLFVGGGFQKSALAERLHSRGLEGLALFKPYQDQGALSLSLGIPDVHWISLRPELEGLIVPSKVYGIAAAGRPILCIASPDGEIARLVRRYDCGAVVEPGDSQGLVRVIDAMMQDPSLSAKWGRNARAMLDAAFTRRMALAKWRALLESLA
jgi:glycosyltransferase involved in cell wall biosynthesis